MKGWTFPNEQNIVIEVTHPGEPQAKERPRRGKAGNFYTPRATQEAEDVLRWTLRLARRGGVDDTHTFGVWVKFYTNNKKVDGDNLLKTVLDSGNLVVWRDDSQVIEGAFQLFRGTTEPRSEITICTIGSK